MSKEKDAVKKQEWFKMLMECYDKRIQYFGDDKNYPGPWIRGRQAIDYINYSGDRFNNKSITMVKNSS